MPPAKRRRRLPTLINRGLGLLEVILPCGPGEAGGRFLPPGQRDASGFWYPAGYDKPGDIFSPMQRELQENQRRIQKRRLRLRDRTPSPAGGDGTVMLGSTGEAHSPPSEPMPAATAAPAGDGVKAEPAGSEIPVPLPAPLPETNAPTSRLGSRPEAQVGARRSSSLEPPLLPDGDFPRRCAVGVVDSREGSD